ncbi:MAG: hypothetical protein JNK82_05740 [Myxococcaceae bacterium]|nr:hypothetical protein [Myxococcaceae bacterium]
MELKRALSAIEAALWKIDLAAPLNFTTVARVTGPVSDEALRAALPKLQARHPHLRERIEDGHFVEDLELTLELRESAQPWVHEVERELNAHITAPLARFVRAGDHLLITLHHSIGDGMSGVYLMRDWLRAATGAELEPLRDPGAVDHLLPKKPGALGVARLLASEGVDLVRSGRLLQIKRDEERKAYDRRMRMTPVEIEPELVEKLTARARDESTTLHGALSAAMALGVLEQAGREKGGLVFGSPANVRGAVGAGESLGFYVSMLTFRAPVRASTPFWQVARDVRRAIERHLSAKAELSMLKLLPIIWDVIGGYHHEPKAIADGWDSLLPATTGLSNLGRLGIETEYGPLKLESCHFVANVSALGEFASMATSLHGRLFWNFVWPSPVLTDVHAAELIDGIVNRLIAATSGRAGD